MAIDETLNLNAEPYISAVDGSVSALDRLEQKQNSVEQSSQRMSESLRKSFEDAQPGHMSDKEAEELFPTDATSKYGEKLQDVVKDVTGFSVASLGVVAAAAAVTEGLKKSVEVAADYQSNIAKIEANTGQGAEGLDKLKEAVSGTAVSQTEAAQAGVQLSETYKNNTDITNAFSGSMLLSEASSMSMTQAVGMTSAALTKYQLDTTQSSELANIFVAGAQHSKESVTDLGTAVIGAGATAKALGMNITETTAVMMAFSDTGLKGGDASSTFSLAMRGLMKDNKNVTDTLSEMKLKFSDIDPTMHSFDDITSTLAEHHMTLTQSFALFGRAGTPMFNMIEDGGKKMKAYQDAVTGTNSAEEAAARNNETYDKSMEKLSASVVAAENDIGSVLLPALADFVTVIGQAVTGATKLGETIWNWGDSAAHGAVALGQSAGNAVAGWEKWGDTMLGNDPNASANELAKQQQYAGDGTLCADTWSAAYEAQMQADTSEEDPYVMAAIKRQSEKYGQAGAFAAGQAALEEVKKSGISEQLWSGIMAGFSTAETVAMINRQNDFNTATDQLGMTVWNDKNKKLQATSGEFTLGDWYISDTGASAWQLRTQRWGNETLDQKDPIGDANRRIAAHLKEEGKTPSEQFGTAATGEPMIFPIVAKLEVSTIIDKSAVANSVYQELAQTIQDAVKAGTLNDTDNQRIQDDYKKLLAIDPSMVKDVSAQNLKFLNENMGKLGDLEDKLATMRADHIALSNDDYWKKYNDSYEHGTLNLMNLIRKTGDQITEESDKLNKQIFTPVILDQKLYNETEWKDAGTKIGEALANGAVDTFQEKTDLSALRDKFVKEGDVARTDFMTHVINGDWSIPMLEAKGKELGMAFTVGFKENLDLFGNAIPEALKGFDLAAYLKDPKSQESMISNTKDFVENVFQPALKDSVDKMDVQLSKGMVETLQPASDLMDNLMLKASQRPDMFTTEEMRTMEAYRAGIISLQEAFDRLDGKGDQWVSNLDNRMAVFQKHQVAFDMYYKLNKNTDESAQAPESPNLGIQGYKNTGNGIESYSNNYFYGQPIPTNSGSPVPVNIVQDSSTPHTSTRNDIAQPSAGGAGGTSNPLTQTGFNTQMATTQLAITTGLTTLNSSVQLIENTGIATTLIKGMAKSVTDIGTAETKEFTDLKKDLLNDTNSINAAIGAAAAGIEKSLAAVAEVIQGGNKAEGGAGSPEDLSNAFQNFSTFGSGGEPGVGSNFSPFGGSFAEGGDFIASSARMIQVGEAGPERVTITPLNEARASANLGLNLETSSASRQLSDIIRKIENSTPTLKLQVQLDVETYYFQTMLENAVKLAFQSVKVR